MNFPRPTTKGQGRSFRGLSLRPIFSTPAMCLVLVACAAFLLWLDG
jgi:hypothetical protein